MKLCSAVDEIKTGRRIAYNDGRPGHAGVRATVIEVDANGMTVLFEDRADESYIRFSDRGWMDFVEVADCKQKHPPLLHLTTKLTTVSCFSGEKW